MRRELRLPTAYRCHFYLACLCWLLLTVPAWSQQAPDPGSIFSEADRLMTVGDPVAARQQILSVMAADAVPAVLAGGALRLAQLAQLAGDMAGAERPLLEALALLPAADPSAQPGLAAIYLQLGAIAMARGDMSRAQIALLKGLSIAKRLVTVGDPAILEGELMLAFAEIRSFRLPEATKRLAVLEPRAKSATPRLAALYQGALGELNFRQYRYAPALAAQEESLRLLQAAYGPAHPEVARAETSLGAVLFSAGRYQEAEKSLQQAISIYDTRPDYFAPAAATALTNLGQVYYTTGRYALAVLALDRSVKLARQAFGRASQAEAAALLHLGFAKLRQNDIPGAKVDLAAAIDLWSAPATRNPRAAAGASVWLAEALRRSGDYDGAVQSLDQAGTTLEHIFGPDSFALSDVLVGRAEVAMARGSPVDALDLLRRARNIRTNWVGASHIATLEASSLLALALAESGDLGEGLEAARSVTAALRQRIAVIQSVQSGAAIEEIAALRRLIGRHVHVIDMALRQTQDGAVKSKLLAESVDLAQLARNSAAGTAIAGLGQRQALTDPAATAALRQVQEAVLQWQMAERSLAASVVSAHATSSAEPYEASQDDVDAFARKVSDLQLALLASFPSVAELQTQEPLPLADLDALLKPNEAMLVYLALDDGAYLWVLRREQSSLISLDTNESLLRSQIRSLRKTLDPKVVQSLSDIQPYDVETANGLYETLVAPARLSADATQMIIVPDGVLQSLPFAALLSAKVASPTDFSDYRRLPWLVRDRAISILPEIGALRALRKSARSSAATRPFIGFGDPVLLGQMPADTGTASVADLLRGLQPLPDSADELAGLATALKAAPTDIVTGAAATEAALKASTLGDYHVIAFATHGLMAGDFGRLREPGLVLTPPATATGDDDGLLTVGEIAQLKLDADWVVLSACNTAAPDGSPGAEGLSGLARAFFFAGSRTLLVSQWEVLSVAAVGLTNGIFEQMMTDTTLGRADALQHSILSMMSEEQPDYMAHPIFWAPFELVGEGA
jgi:CHAT domain-containing protein/tetratricopeptide (TPR) repeat protein